MRPRVNGRQICLTFDFRPTKADIDKIIKEYIKPTSMSLSDALNNYVEMKEVVLSPSTIKSYRHYIKNMPPKYLDTDLNQIDSFGLQSLANEYIVNHSVKYARNVIALVTATLAVFAPDKSFKVTFPRKKDNGAYKPSDEDIKRLLDESRGTMFEVALWLAAFGLRRSEQICLTNDDLKGNVLTINKSRVQAANNTWVTKETKTAASVRKIILPDYVVDLINEKGFYKGHPNSIVCWLYKAQDRLGIPRFSLHYFRHFFAAKMSVITDEASVLELGGWKTDHVFKNTYRYALPENVSKAQEDASTFIKSLL